MKLIFLDFDGVMNCFEKKADDSLPHQAWCPEVMNAFGISLEIFPEMVERLNRITDATDAKIIVSSSWRIGYLAEWADVVIHLHNIGVKGFILGRTPWSKHDSDMDTRGKEIEAWLKSHPNENVESFVILDDSELGLDSLNNNFVRTDFQKGMQDNHVERAIEILNGK